MPSVIFFIAAMCRLSGSNCQATNRRARRPASIIFSDPRLPVCIFADGTRIECPSLRQITEKLGWFRSPLHSEYDLAIYGGGPGGLERRRLRRFRRTQDGPDRAVRDWRAGGIELQDRKLPGVSEGNQRSRSGRTRARAGLPLRRRDSSGAGRRSRRIFGRQRNGIPCRRHQNCGPSRDLRDRRRLPPARPAERGRVSSEQGCITAPGQAKLPW